MPGTYLFPFTGKDVDRLAKATTAWKVLVESKHFLEDWPAKVPNAERLKAAIDRYHAAYEDARNGDRIKIAARLAASDETGMILQKIVNYAASTEEDNTALLLEMGVLPAGRSSYSGASHRDMPAPGNVKVVNAEEHGAVIMSCARLSAAYSYVVQISEGDPTVEENWKETLPFGRCGRMVIQDLTPGKQYSFRVRGIGKDSPGPWSHAVTTIIT